MGKFAEVVWLNYFEIFNENSEKQRHTFFSDPIIQFLWAKFVKSPGYKLNEVLASLTDSPKDVAKKQSFISDIRKIENETGCQIMGP